MKLTNQLLRYFIFGDSQRRLVGWIHALTRFVGLTPQLSASTDRVEQIYRDLESAPSTQVKFGI